MTPERFKNLQQVLSQRQMDLTVLMDGVHKPHNFNAIIRTCDAIGVFEAHLVPVEGGYKPFSITAKGAQKYVYTHKHETVEKGIEHLKSEGKQVLAAHWSEKAVDFRTIDYTKPTAIVMGSELRGLSKKAADAVDQHVTIPMMGMVESLNVSVACAVILHQAQEQRLKAGLYDTRALSDADYERLLFEWSWPKIARLCRRLNKPYPLLNEDGDFNKF
ncbi:tRNA (guanosine(18)-2'-O)-methyltransferase TrmH [Marinicella rhabdoformis]|uniref:tRNA (guanosine(18)-2'-O)-methyltransferase TrmH n=1 Tax=Marinicella rhabdoformis TaxID=2580566 RepID=UPI0012AECD9F|nr:tRNA (guanosine(18)-2'-O)-methyltransferase TrmH [Marinicella rhabdoformis]